MLHPLDSPAILSICLNTVAIDQRAVLPNCIGEATKAQIRICFLKRIYAPSHLWRGGAPKMSNKVTVTLLRWSQSKKAKTARTREKHFMLSDPK